MTDRLEALSRLGIDPAARAASPARVRRDERRQEGRKQRQEQDARERPQPEDAEDDGRPHVDVRA